MIKGMSSDHVQNNKLLSKHVLYNEEEKRLRTFDNWPAHYPVDPSRLAKSGFYYTGNADEVVCFSCGGHMSDWQYGDIVQKRHMEKFPNCDFINNRSNNVALVNVNTGSAVACASFPASHHTAVRNYNKNCVLQCVSYDDGNENLVSKMPENACPNSDNILTSSALNIETDSKSSESNSSKPVFEFHKMVSLEERLKTFKFGWPLLFPDVPDIAAAGFFYLGMGDKVQCAFCRGIVKNWEAKDVPLVEHTRHFPNCKFVQNLQNQQLNVNSSLHTEGQDVCGSSDECFQQKVPASTHKLIDKDQQHTKLNELGINLHSAPAHPEQATLAARLQTFLSWPETVPVKKEALAAAGFFYLGFSDHTTCFYCDGGLCSWEPYDDPWVEHARWFRNCNFLRLNKDDSFIKQCVEKAQSPSSCNTTDENQKQAAMKSSNSYFDNALICKVEEAMKSSLISAILKTNVYPPYLIRAAVFQQIRSHGIPFGNVEEVCEAVNLLKEKIKSNINIGIQEAENETSPCNVVMKIGSSISEISAMQQKDKPKHLIGKMENAAEPEADDSKLVEENRFLRDQRLCKVCMDNDVSVVFLPCGHLLACTLCAPALHDCPLCRKSIQATVRAYLP